VLLLLAATFVLLFYWQRSRSTFLRIEQERPAAAELAKGAGLDVADVFALRDMIGLEASTADWQRVVAEFAAHLHVGKMRVANDSSGGAAGHGAAGAAGGGAAGTLPAATPPEMAFAASQIAPNALAARRFLLLRERFRSRR
tara:strand:- start:861 stop:1286 length:426 start_codon:yes stop_codon:yes gene_type:complete